MMEEDLIDISLILKYTGWNSFDPEDWKDVMNLVTKIENSRPHYSVWVDITPSTTTVTDEMRILNGERMRREEPDEAGLYLYVPPKTYQRSNKERNKKRHIIEACVLFLKDQPEFRQK